MTETLNTEIVDLKEVFVAAPFWQLLKTEDGLMPGEDRSVLETVITYFEQLGCVVYNAHRREGWGGKLMEPHEFTRLDYDQIAASDLLVAFPGQPASPGTHVELGWASAMGKPIVLMLERGKEYAGLVVGLPYITVVEVVEFEPGEDFMADLVLAVERALAAHAVRQQG